MKTLGIYTRIFIVACMATTATAKRLAPKPVPSVTRDGIEFSAPRDRMGFVVATSVKTSQEIWAKQIYVVKYNVELERDVQWCFITGLKLDGKKLLITNEKGSTFELDTDSLEMKTIKGSAVIDHAEIAKPSVCEPPTSL